MSDTRGVQTFVEVCRRATIFLHVLHFFLISHLFSVISVLFVSCCLFISSRRLKSLTSLWLKWWTVTCVTVDPIFPESAVSHWWAEEENIWSDLCGGVFIRLRRQCFCRFCARI